MPKPNPLPLENCSREEAENYLKTHIENLNEEIERLETALTTNEADKQQRAWSIDIASRFFDRVAEPDFAKVEAFAVRVNQFAEGTKQ